MLGTSLGQFDPVNFDENVPSTFPPAPAGGFAAGQFYVLTGPTTVGGAQLVAGDRLYVTEGTGRTMGSLTLGDLVLGGDVWSVSYVHWIGHNTTAPPWQNVAPPYAGCPFFPLKDTGLTEADPQWRIVVEAYYTDITNARLLGTGTFGSDVLGDDPLNVPIRWADITEPSFAITIAVGDDEGGPIVPSTQITWEVSDPDEDYIVWQTPGNLYSVQVHTPIRVSLQDPNFQVYPLAVGRVERIEDEHDVPPRTLTVEAFGLMTDLVQHMENWNRPAEEAVTRIEAALVEAGWAWGSLIHPAAGNNGLGVGCVANDASEDIVEIRAEVQNVSLSNRMTLDCDRFGRLRMRWWPLEPTGPVIGVADCPDHLPYPALPAQSILLVADTAELLNKVELETVHDPPIIVEATDITSVGRYGVRDSAYGFPATALVTNSQSTLQGYAQAIVDRLGRIVNRVDGVVGNIAHDLGWLDVIATIDTGQPIVTHRVGIPNRDVALDAVVVGYEIRLAPGEATIDIATQSITTTV